MMKLVTLIGSLLFSSLSLAQPDYSLIASKLYQTNLDDQAFTLKFFNIVEAHKNADPLCAR